MPQRPISDYLDEVTEDKVQAVFVAIERHGATFRPGRPGRWVCDDPRLNFGRTLSGVINEMIRTGLLSHAIYRWGENETHHLVPASRHLADPAAPALSMCRFPGEGKGPKRSRLTTDTAAVNCPDCRRSSSLTHEL